MLRQKKQHTIIIISSIVALFFVTRLYNILSVPIFTDESIYIRWAELFKNNSHEVLVSLTDGKQPLFIWVMSGFLRIFHDPLLAGRLTSVLAGFLTMLGLYFLTNELFKNKRIAIGSCLIYILYPFSLLYDRMALYDSMVATFAVWSLYVEVLLVKRRSFGIAIITAIVIGGALLTKSSADFYIYLLPFSLVLFDYKSERKYKDFFKWVATAVVVVAGAYGIASILRLSPLYKNLASKNDTFVYTFSEWIKHPFLDVVANAHILFDWLVGYSTIPLLLLVILAFLINKKYLKEKLLLFAWFMLPITVLAFFGKSLLPRYILFMTLPLLVLASYAAVTLMNKIKIKYLGYLLIFLLAIPMLWKDYLLLTDFAKAPIPESDHYQYIAGFPSGVGVKQTVALLEARAKNQKIYLGTETVFGLLPDALQDYLNNDRNIVIQPLTAIGPTTPSFLLAESKYAPTYMVFSSPCPYCREIGVAPQNWQVKLVYQAVKLDKNTFFTLYQVQ